MIWVSYNIFNISLLRLQSYKDYLKTLDHRRSTLDNDDTVVFQGVISDANKKDEWTQSLSHYDLERGV